jgi:hypothetical protein
MYGREQETKKEDNELDEVHSVDNDCETKNDYFVLK